MDNYEDKEPVPELTPAQKEYWIRAGRLQEERRRWVETTERELARQRVEESLRRARDEEGQSKT